MVKFLGWTGFLLLTGTLIPFVMRYLHPRRTEAAFFARHHHSLALACLAVLTLHGLFVLTGRRGWEWAHLKGGVISSGIITWLVLLAVFMFALFAVRKKPFPRTHCRLVGLLVFLVLFHVL